MGSDTIRTAQIYPEMELITEEIELIEEIEEIEIQSNTIEPEDIELKKIKRNIIDKLPNEIANLIYKCYLEPELYYLQYRIIIESPESTSLNGIKIVPFIPIILGKPLVCKYILSRCPQFNYSYKEHKINKKKVFQLMKKGQSFGATILFSLYH